MGFFKKKMSVDEAESVLISPSEPIERVREAYKAFFGKTSTYYGRYSTSLLLSLALFRGADPEELMSKNGAASFNVMSLRLDEEFYESTTEIMRAFPEYSAYMLDLANQRENFGYLCDAYRFGWGVDVDDEKAEEYAKKC